MVENVVQDSVNEPFELTRIFEPDYCLLYIEPSKLSHLNTAGNHHAAAIDDNQSPISDTFEKGMINDEGCMKMP